MIEGRMLPVQLTPVPAPESRVRFPKPSEFSRDLDAGVEAYFAKIGAERRDSPRMYLKTAIILGWMFCSWVLLVFYATNASQAVVAALSLGFAGAAVGMSIQHDANHGSYSKHTWVNRLFGCTLDMMGVWSFVWRPKHNIAHHTFTNVEGIDYDLDFGGLARLSPEQPLRSWHRYQHLYLWFFYGFILPKWVFHDDFVIARKRYIGVHKLPTAGPSNIAAFIVWKLIFVGWAIVLPAFFHPLWQVLLFHFIAAYTLGATLGTVFQLAHCVDAADFPAAAPKGEKMPTDWATHQLNTTVDFAPRSALITWMVGGLNFQVEHHLYPKICHVHYPALANVVDEIARKHGLQRRCHATLVEALSSHFAHLRKLGRPAPSLAFTPTRTRPPMTNAIRTSQRDA